MSNCSFSPQNPFRVLIATKGFWGSLKPGPNQHKIYVGLKSIEKIKQGSELKAAVYYDINDIRYEEVPLPEISRDEVLVRMEACGLCGTDLHKILNRAVPPPAVLGHEVAGQIERLGSQVEGFKQGDKVIVFHHIPCFVCTWCRHGNHSLCPEFKKLNISPGGFAEYLRVSGPSVKSGLLKIPDSLSYEEATLIEPTACCLRAIARADLRPGDTVVVIGAGPAGLLHIQLCRLLGASKVMAVDRVMERLNTAASFGAEVTANSETEDIQKKIKETTGGMGADIAIVAAGNIKAIKSGINLVRPGGTVLFFAESPAESILEVDPNLIYHSEVTLIGSYSSTPHEHRQALSLIASGRLKAKQLITHRFKLYELSEAVKLATRAGDSLKIILTP